MLGPAPDGASDEDEEALDLEERNIELELQERKERLEIFRLERQANSLKRRRLESVRGTAVSRAELLEQQLLLGGGMLLGRGGGRGGAAGGLGGTGGTTVGGGRRVGGVLGGGGRGGLGGGLPLGGGGGFGSMGRPPPAGVPTPAFGGSSAAVLGKTGGLGTVGGGSFDGAAQRSARKQQDHGAQHADGGGAPAPVPSTNGPVIGGSSTLVVEQDALSTEQTASGGGPLSAASRRNAVISEQTLPGTRSSARQDPTVSQQSPAQQEQQSTAPSAADQQQKPILPAASSSQRPPPNTDELKQRVLQHQQKQRVTSLTQAIAAVGGIPPTGFPHPGAPLAATVAVAAQQLLAGSQQVGAAGIGAPPVPGSCSTTGAGNLAGGVVPTKDGTDDGGAPIGFEVAEGYYVRKGDLVELVPWEDGPRSSRRRSSSREPPRQRASSRERREHRRGRVDSRRRDHFQRRRGPRDHSSSRSRSRSRGAGRGGPRRPRTNSWSGVAPPNPPVSKAAGAAGGKRYNGAAPAPRVTPRDPRTRSVVVVVDDKQEVNRQRSGPPAAYVGQFGAKDEVGSAWGQPAPTQQKSPEKGSDADDTEDSEESEEYDPAQEQPEPQPPAQKTNNVVDVVDPRSSSGENKPPPPPPTEEEVLVQGVTVDGAVASPAGGDASVPGSAPAPPPKSKSFEEYKELQKKTASLDVKSLREKLAKKKLELSKQKMEMQKNSAEEGKNHEDHDEDVTRGQHAEGGADAAPMSRAGAASSSKNAVVQNPESKLLPPPPEAKDLPVAPPSPITPAAAGPGGGQDDEISIKIVHTQGMIRNKEQDSSQNLRGAEERDLRAEQDLHQRSPESTRQLRGPRANLINAPENSGKRSATWAAAVGDAARLLAKAGGPRAGAPGVSAGRVAGTTTAAGLGGGLVGGTAPPSVVGPLGAEAFRRAAAMGSESAISLELKTADVNETLAVDML